MSTRARPATAPVVPLWAVSAAFWLIVVAVAAARAAGVAESQVLGTFGVVFVSIVVEALPSFFLARSPPP